jgi:hypothetical protein
MLSSHRTQAMWMLTPPQSPCCWINSFWVVSIVNLNDLFLAFDYNLGQSSGVPGPLMWTCSELLKSVQICAHFSEYDHISLYACTTHVDFFSCVQLYQSARICGIFMLFLPQTNNALPTYKQKVHCLYLSSSV